MNKNQVNSVIVELLSDLTGEQLSQERVTPQLIFIAAVVIVLLGVIFADGTIEPSEEKRLRKILHRCLKGKDDLEELTQKMIDQVQSRHLYTQTDKLGTLTAPFSKSENFLLIALGYEMSAADGVINPREKAYLENIAKRRLKTIDWERHMPVLEASFIGTGQGEKLPLALSEVKTLLKKDNFTGLGDGIVSYALDILKTVINEFDDGKHEIWDDRH